MPFGVIYRAASFMAKQIWTSVTQTLVKSVEAMTWLQKAASAVAGEGLPIRWASPVGFPVMQAYWDIKERRITTALQGGVVKLTMGEYTDKLDRKAQANGISPNFVHSCDAAHMMLTTVRAEQEGMLKTALHLGLDVLHDFIVVGLDTGFRRTELLRLAPTDFHKDMLMVHAGETKNGSARSVPCSKRVKAIVEKRLADGSTKLFPGLNIATLRKQWGDLRSLLGKDDDPGFIVHVLRHTCATRLVSEGVPLTTVQAWMGHKVIQTTMRYAHMVGGQLQEAMKRLEDRKVVSEDA